MYLLDTLVILHTHLCEKVMYFLLPNNLEDTCASHVEGGPDATYTRLQMDFIYTSLKISCGCLAMLLV